MVTPDITEKVFNLPLKLRAALHSIESGYSLSGFCEDIGLSFESYKEIKKNIISTFIGEISFEDFESFLSLSWPERHLEIFSAVNKYYFDPVASFVENSESGSFITPTQTIEEIETAPAIEAHKDEAVEEERETIPVQNNGPDKYREQI